MNFKQWLYKRYSTTQFEYVDKTQSSSDPLFDAATQLATKHNLPNPRKFIAKGNYASIYETDNPKVILRITSADSTQHVTDSQCDKKMAETNIQKSGGVVKIFKQFVDSINGEQYLVSYKEKVNTEWQNFLKSKYDPVTYKNIMHIFQWELPAKDTNLANQALEKLKQYPETRNLAKAVQNGIPNHDLTSDNLGVDSNGNIVAIDC